MLFIALAQDLIYCTKNNLYSNFLNLHILWNFTPTGFTILNEPGISSFNNSCTMGMTVKHIPF